MKRSYCNTLLKARIEFSTLYWGFSPKDDSEPYFSPSGCDICPDGLAGDVHDVTYLAKADTEAKNYDNHYEAEICNSCLCSLVNGDDSDLDYICDDEDEEALTADEAADELKADKAGILNKREVEFKESFSNLMLQLSCYGNYKITVNGESDERSANELYNRFFNNATDEETRDMTRWLSENETGKIMEFLANDISFDFYFSSEE